MLIDCAPNFGLIAKNAVAASDMLLIPTKPEWRAGHRRRGDADSAGLATTLVDGVLADRKDTSSQRIAVILNGLGRTKYEELFVVWGEVAACSASRGYPSSKRKWA